MEGPGPGNPELDAFIRSQIRAKLDSLKAQVDDEYFERAVQLYSKPGSPLRQQFFKMKADQAAAEAKKAQLGGTGMDALERTARDVGTGLVRGATSTLRFAGHAFSPNPGAGMMQDNMQSAADRQTGQGLEGWLQRQSGEGAMGGRGLSPNPIIGSIQSAVEPAAEMAGALPLANKAMGATGNVLQNVANRAPQSRVLSALAGTSPGMQGPMQAGAGAAVGRIAGQIPSAMIKGSVAGAVAMPDETFAHGEMGTNLGLGAGLSVLDALAAGRLPRAPRSGPGAISSFFQDPNPVNKVPLLDDMDRFAASVTEPTPTAPAAAPQAPAAAATAPSAGAEPGKGFTGGERLDFTKLDPTQATAAQKLWESAKTPQERAKLLGAETEMGMVAGKNPKVEVVENITNAKSPQDLFGYLQKRLIKAASGSAPKMQPGTQPRTGAGKVKGPSASTTIRLTPDQSLDPIPATPEQTAMVERGEQVIAEHNARSLKGKRPGRQDVLRDAPRLEDGTLDWDKLDAPQREAVAGLLGTSYREKVKTMSMANIQKVLSNAQFDSFMRALKRQPRATGMEAAPVEQVAATLDDALIKPGEELPVVPSKEPAKTASPRSGKGVPIQQVVPGKGVALTDAPPSAEKAAINQQAGINPAASPNVDVKKVSPGWWDSEHATPEQKKALVQTVLKQRQMPGDPELFARTPFDQLPPGLRMGLPQLDAPGLPKAEGGAPVKGAPFRGKRKGAKQ